MKRRLTTKIAGLAMFASLLFAAPAMAAPGLGVEISHYPATIFANDAFVGYEVKVQNTGDEPSAGALTVSISLSAGMALKRATGTGWTCTFAVPYTCTNSTAVAPGASYPTLDLSEVRIEAGAPAVPVATASASGGGAPIDISSEDSFVFAPAVPFEINLAEAKALDELGDELTQAGGHPYEAFAMFETTKLRGPKVSPSEEIPLTVEDVHGGVAELPPGLVGNPEAVEASCDFGDLNAGNCPVAAAVGGVQAFARGTGVNPPGPGSPKTEPVYRLTREDGYPASFGFQTEAGFGPSFVVRAKLRSDGDFGITTLIPLVPQEPKFFGANFAFCGFGAEVSPSGSFAGCKKPDDPDANTDAFVSLSTDCSVDAPTTRFAVDSWTNRGALGSDGLPNLSDPAWKQKSYASPAVTGCEQLTEEWVDEKAPTFTMQPDSHAADTPAGYTAHLHIPQDGLEDPNGLATSHLKDTSVTLPPGVSLNPSIGNGLQACSLEQIGYLGNNFPYPNRIRFDTDLPQCPAASKIGTAEVITPLLTDPLRGSVYLAAQKANPFGTNYAVYLAIEEEKIGVIAKLAGRVDLNPVNGQITATFKDNPQIPFEDLELRFFGGNRAPLANPVTCGPQGVNSSFTPWSAANPDAPQPAEIAHSADTVQINAGANGAACPATGAQRPFAVGLDAGAEKTVAGAKTPFSIRITRPDGSQELDRLEISPPSGFVASLRGVPYCSEAQIAAANAAGSGRAEQSNPSCPKASEIGSVIAGAGPGANPLYVPGKLYLAGPYKGAPLSVVAITPAVAGPFDLGNVVIRSAVRVDPVTARLTAVTDPLPQIFQGIPLRLRDVRINLDRPNWAQNPTNCNAMAVDVTGFGASGAVSNLSNRFQVGGCKDLPFGPRLNLRLKGATKRIGHPALRAVLTARPGEANIARAQVNLPHGEFLDQGNLNKTCTRPVLMAGNCPKSSVYGRARAWTPLLDEPLQGNVYLVGGYGYKLPALVADLNGQIRVTLVGKVDSGKNKGIRNTFEVVPDAPVEKFELAMKGGRRYGLLENSENLCKAKKAKRRAIVRFTGQNGKVKSYKPVVRNDCGKKHKKRKKNAGHARSVSGLAGSNWHVSGR